MSAWQRARGFAPAAVLGVFWSTAGCGAAGPSSKYPPLPGGCAVTTYPEAPPLASDNIGPVRASCDPDVSDADCLRELEDQVCKLGGTFAWGVDEKPAIENGRKVFRGRAARAR